MNKLAHTLCGLVLMAPIQAQTGGVHLRQLRRIHVQPNAHWAEALAAKVLQEQLGKHYGVTLEVTEGQTAPGTPAVFVGREQAIASGVVTPSEVEATKHDGYVIKSAGNRIALAGYRGRGSLYAAYALLERMGVRMYPDRSSWTGPVEVFEPLPDQVLPAVDEIHRPFFEYRGCRSGVNQGRFGGGSWKDMGDVRTAANPELFSTRHPDPERGITGRYCSSQHTAGYLVPKELYYDEHPDYYAMRPDGTRIPKTTSYHRLMLNMMHPDVRRISAERMVEWMDVQRDRRFFYAVDGDARMCKAPASLAADPHPHYCTDRMLGWLNHIAVAARAKHPEKRIFAAAYIETVKPPVLSKPEPNVLVLCCPWYWTSVNTRSHDFTHPQNIVAMEEFVGWNLCCPGQVGVFDYPYPYMVWLRGQADRIKFYARHGVRAVDLDGAPLPFEDLCHHVISRLLWDPLLDSVKLEEDFIRVFYGPAAQPIGEYFRYHHASSAKYYGRYHRDPELIAHARRLFARAEEQAGNDDMHLLRVQHDVLRWLATYLKPKHGELVSSSKYELAPVTAHELDAYRRDLMWYLRLTQRLFETCKRLGDRPRLFRARACQSSMKKVLATCGGVKLNDNVVQSLWSADAQAAAQIGSWVDHVAPGIREHLEQYEAPAVGLAPQPRAVTLAQPRRAEEARDWSLECTQSGLASPTTIGVAASATGQQWRGLKASIPLSRLPVTRLPTNPKGVSSMHAGTFLLSTALDPPAEVSGCHFFELRVYASAAVPITVYLDTGMGGLRSDVQLHAGVQIVRIDVRHHRRLWRSWKQWDQKLRGIKIDFWPQDNFHPYPPARDVTVVLMDITARNQDRTPADLPHRGEAIWLTHFRPNVPHQICRFGDPGRPVVGAKFLRHVDGTLDRDRYTPEAFRSKTPHGTLSPIFAIVTGSQPSDAERDTARELQTYLQKLYGVRLPVESEGVTLDRDLGNVIVIGREAALTCGLARLPELERVGPEGFVIRARYGRIGIAGADDRGTLYGLSRFLREQGCDFLVSGRFEQVADHERDGFLHETYVLDWPHFRERPLPGGWRLQTQAPDDVTGALPSPADATNAHEVAAAIKAAARGRRPLSREALGRATASPLSTYVAARLLWNPFLDTSRLIGRFRRAGPASAGRREKAWGR